jgi:homoaconitase/3-isopropylmalate dehydratase large subunit
MQTTARRHFGASQLDCGVLVGMKVVQALRSPRMFFFIGPQADPDAEYAEVHEISLADVDSMVALYPSPDNGMVVEGF